MSASQQTVKCRVTSLFFGLLRCDQQQALVRYFMYADMHVCVRACVRSKENDGQMERMRMCGHKHTDCVYYRKPVLICECKV